MKIFSLAALLALGLVFHPFGTAAEASDMQGMKHEGMHMKGDMVLIGDQVVDGVKAMAHIMVYDDAARVSMAKMGMDATHHLMMLFVDEQSGRSIAGGSAALKIQTKEGDAGNPTKLMPMKMEIGSGFGSDIALPEKGEVTFLVGTKLEDGKKRQFEFNFHQ
ncbi:hypothetical protein DBW_0277 [Desulfuromonas sp. DDH964]|uniref:hypothetical protein n=1 Tax=Desulfuromonas sp. DDH964 TaxID=1823759 RepID=UPI00078D0AB8|nr:hypothetical protein [Desulfuromonas sp. DDH964]AMV70677.1 hypothetical protein DBW_0277 [Desulfuromonas sp. DDH964]